MYLIQTDFKKLIQTDNLNQIIGSDSTLLTSASISAVTELISYLVQKYNCTREFADLDQWYYTKAYKANERVYLDATAYNASITYALHALALQAGNVYICTTAIVAPEAFNAAHWTLLGEQYKLFYVTLPKTEFNYNDLYVKDNQVWWKDKTYTAKQATVVINHITELQYGSYNNLPAQNPAPDVDAKFWGTGTAYALTAGTLPTDSTKWTAGDNRNPQLVNYCIDIALYTLHSRIAPRNIPDLRVKRYDEVISWLKNVAKGNITAALPLLQPTSGMRVRFGGNIKNQNKY